MIPIGNEPCVLQFPPRHDNQDDNEQTINPLLGLILGPHLIFSLPNNELCHYSFTIKKVRHILISGQHFTNTFCDTGDPSWVILGVILGIIHFLSKRDPPKVISCRYKVLIESDIFEITPKITPKITPR